MSITLHKTKTNQNIANIILPFLEKFLLELGIQVLTQVNLVEKTIFFLFMILKMLKMNSHDTAYEKITIGKQAASRRGFNNF